MAGMVLARSRVASPPVASSENAESSTSPPHTKRRYVHRYPRRADTRRPPSCRSRAPPACRPAVAPAPGRCVSRSPGTWKIGENNIERQMQAVRHGMGRMGPPPKWPMSRHGVVQRARIDEVDPTLDGTMHLGGRIRCRAGTGWATQAGPWRSLTVVIASSSVMPP